MSDSNLSFDPYVALVGNTLADKTTGYSNFGYLKGINEASPNFEISNIDDLLSIAGIGPLDSAVTANFWGCRKSGQQMAMPAIMENTGLTFFTKPRMKLTDDNLVGNMLSLLASDNSTSMARAIRAFLDPYTGGTKMNTATMSKGMNVTVYKSDIVDPLNPFITILGNNLLTMTGFPDVDVNTYTSPEGMFHESWSMIDDFVTLYNTYEINCSFRNMYGDAIGILFYLWLFYAGSVYLGDINPYIDSIIDNEIDYQTRIYRLVLDSTRTRVLKIWCCGAAFPTAAGVGESFNITEGKPYNDKNDYNVSFKCIGSVYYDPRIIKWFNKTVCNFNQSMTDGVRESVYVKIPYAKMHTMENMGYPRINPSNMDLEWWIDPTTYNELIKRGY